MVDWLWQNSQQLGGLGQLVMAAIAGIGLGFAWGQIAIARRVHVSWTAKEFWRGFEQSCFANPDLADPSHFTIDFTKKTIDGDKLKFEKYDWFISLFLNAAEEIFYMTNRRDWRNALAVTLRTHREFLLASYTINVKKYYRPEFASFVSRCLKKD